ncbi:MAG: hypothetical protein MUO58_02025 [Anaerolineales bacterium]|nr:hypothetical protein [Anaerolineales bacterium]
MRLNKFSKPQVLIPILAVALRLIPGARTVDDAFITFRYAQNLIAGNGLVYNPGEWVLGTTTPLFAVLIAAIGSITGGIRAPYPEIAVVINALVDAISCLIIIRLSTNLGYRRAGIAAALIWAAAPMSVTFAIGGMETSLFILLMLATFYMHSNNQPVLAALFGSLCLLTRPDALLFIFPLGLERVVRFFRSSKRRLPYAEIAAFLIPVVIWSAISWIYYGNPLPRSMAAKAVAYQLPPEAGMVRLLQHYATPFFSHLVFGSFSIAIGLILFPTLFMIGWRRIVREKTYIWPLAIYPIIYLLAFSIANPLIFRWYLTPPLPMYFLGIFIGIEVLGRDIRSPLPLAICSVLAFGFTLNGWTLHPDHGPDRPAPTMAYIKLEEIYLQVATDLRGQIRKEQTLAAGDIGVLGYYTGARILDTVGLISPESEVFYPLPDELYVTNYAIPPDLIHQAKPDYLVLLEVYGRYGLLMDPRFLDEYELADRIQTDIYGSDGMLVYIRD